MTDLDRQSVIDWLKSIGYPALPVAPAQDPYQYPRVVKAKPNEGSWEHCPFNKNALLKGRFEPDPAFTGKNPSYLDADGKPCLVSHQAFQNRLPTKTELKKWFTNPINGVGTLGGWNGIIWVDLDRKHFNSQDDCNRAVGEILTKLPALIWTEQTPSGGYHIAVKPKKAPDFTNFALEPDGRHVGEALGAGKFVVLAPTPSYIRLNSAAPVEIESLESIGIYSTKKVKTGKPKGGYSQPASSAIPGSILLKSLGSDTSRQVLSGEDIKGDRSDSLTTGVKEWCGWANWCEVNEVPYSGNAMELSYVAGKALGLDSDRIDRIIDSIEIGECHPATQHEGGDESCWKKIRQLNKTTFEAKCPADLRTKIEAAHQEQREQYKTQPEPQKTGSKLAANIRKFSALFNDRLRFNQVSGFYEFDGKQTTLEDLEIILACDFNLDAPRNFAVVVKAIAKPYHPVREYLESCRARYGKTTIGILDGIANRYFGCGSSIHDLFIRKWLIGVARRIYEPGTKFDTVLTLHGKQGLQKSGWFRVLSNGWFDDSIGNVSDKDERIKLHRSWINEWGELEATFKRKDIATIKSFTATQIDRLRPPYGREVVDMPRWSVIVGSTNQDEFLADSTGNRRFWVIPVTKRINLDLLEQERDRIWAAAVALHFQSEPHWLDAEGDEAAAAAVKQYETSDPWENIILDYLDTLGCSETSAGELLSQVLQIDIKDQDRPKQMRITDILKRAGWTRTEKRISKNEKRARVWVRLEPALPAEESTPDPTPTGQPRTQSEPESDVSIEVQAWTTPFRFPSLVPGGKVRYVGDKYPDLNSGQILTLHSKDPVSDCWCVLTPAGRLSTWIPSVDLQPVEGK